MVRLMGAGNLAASSAVRESLKEAQLKEAQEALAPAGAQVVQARRAALEQRMTPLASRIVVDFERMPLA